METRVRMERVGSRPLAVVRRRATRAELPTVVPAACGTVWNAIRALGIRGAGRHVAVYLDDQMNIEIGVELDAPLTGEAGDLIASSTPAGDAAVLTHFGPYQQLPDAHRSIRQWCADQGRPPAGPCWEIYGHWVEEWNKDPGKIRTDVFHLLKSE